MPRFSANLGFLWPELPLLDRIRAAARSGFRAIELHWPYDIPAEEIRDLCSDLNLVLLGLNTPVGDAAAGEFGLAAVPGRQAEYEATLDQTIGYARTAGAGAVHVMAGVVLPDKREEAREILVRNLALAAERAPDLTLLLEPLNRHDKAGYFYSTLAEALAVMDRVGAPNLKLMFDTYHVGRTEGDVLTYLARHLPRIGHVQIAGVPSRAEPDEGTLDYREIFTALDRIGYAGWVGCEYKPRSGTETGLRWVKALGATL